MARPWRFNATPYWATTSAIGWASFNDAVSTRLPGSRETMARIEAR
jgi:hypothetical protein